MGEVTDFAQSPNARDICLGYGNVSTMPQYSTQRLLPFAHVSLHDEARYFAACYWRGRSQVRS